MRWRRAGVVGAGPRGAIADCEPPAEVLSCLGPNRYGVFERELESVEVDGGVAPPSDDDERFDVTMGRSRFSGSIRMVDRWRITNRRYR